MSYGIGIETSSGLTSLEDIYTVKPKGTYTLSGGTSAIDLKSDEDFVYGSLTGLNIDFDPAKDVYFVTSYSVYKETNQVFTNFWGEEIFLGVFRFLVPYSLVLDTVSDEVRLTWYTDYFTSFTLTPRSGGELLVIELTIVQVKA